MKLLCVSDIHDEESKFKQMAGWAKGHDALITAGDDLDRYGKQGIEADVLLGTLLQQHQVLPVSQETAQEFQELLQQLDNFAPDEQNERLNAFLGEHPEVRENILHAHEVKAKFLAHYEARAEAINKYYTQANIPAYGTPGNHDPLPALRKMDAVKFLGGEVAKHKDLTIAGLPATGEWVPGPSQVCPDFYPHLKAYHPEEVSGLAQRLLQHDGKIDVLITHKAYRADIQEWDKYYREGQPLHEFGVDAGAVAVDKKFKPALNVFGHYHMDRAKVKRSEDGKQWFLYVGPNAAVSVAFQNKKPFEFQGKYYA